MVRMVPHFLAAYLAGSCGALEASARTDTSASPAAEAFQMV